MSRVVDWRIATGGGLVDLAAGEAFSGEAFAGRVSARCERLQEAGLRPGQVAAIVQDDAAAVLTDLLALWQAGACAAVLDPSLSRPEQENVAAFLRPALVLAAGGIAAGADEPRTMTGDGLDAPALILLTSGTTGDPKAVVHSHRGLLARVELNRAHIGDGLLGRTLLTLPLHFGHGLIGNALTALVAGGTLFIHPRGPALAARLGAIVDENAIRFLSSVPSFWQLALRTSPPPRGDSLGRVHVGSAPLTPLLMEKIAAWSRAEVVNCYGITETANWIGGFSSRDGYDTGRVGRPWGGRYGVRGPDGAVALEGEGEILVRTPSLMLGYLDRPGLTEAAMSGGWYVTGDTGRLDAGGALVLSGRIKDEINRAGQKIQPADVDRVIEAHPAVEEACTFGVNDPVSGEAVAAAVVTKGGETLDRAALAAWCGERLRPAAVPERWFFVPAIPRTPRGKVSRIVVRDTLAGGGPPQGEKP